jgi:UDP-glucose 4-epimerase
MGIVAITGVSSYFAHGLLPLLEADERVETIVGLDIKPPSQSVSKLQFHHHDIRDPAMSAYFKDAQTLVHLAFIVDEMKDKAVSHAINVQGTRNVLGALEGSSVRKVVYTSSASVYGCHRDNPVGLTEDMPMRPTYDCYYSSDKVEAEGIFEEFQRTRGKVLVTILRPCIVIGPHIQNMFSRLFELKIIPMLLGKNPLVQFLHEEELNKALCQAIVEDHPGVFNLGGRDPLPMSRLIELSPARGFPIPTLLAKKGANVLFRLGRMPFSQAWVSMQEYPVVVNSERFQKEFGWAPRYSTEESIFAFLDARR